MIRKTIIVVLTLAAAGTTTLYVASCLVQIGGVQVVVADDVWIWVTVGRGSGMVYVLERNQLLDPVEPPRPTRRISRLTYGEWMCYSFYTDLVPPWNGVRWWTFDFTFPDARVTTDDSGFACHEPVSVPGRAVHAIHIGVPLWMVTTLLLIYPAIAFIRGPLRRYRRRKRGLCLRCGYDLTGNVSGVCPECGEAVLGSAEHT